MRITFAAVAVASALQACSPSKATRCERFAEQGLGMVQGLANALGDKVAGEDLPDVALSPEDEAQAKKKAIEVCLTWPDDFVACVTDGDFDSPKCREAYAKKEGVVVRVDAKPGPAPTVREIDDSAALQCHGERCLIDLGERLQDLQGRDLGVGRFVGVVELAGERVSLTAHEGTLTLRGEATVQIKAPRQGPDGSPTSPLAVSTSGLMLFDDGRIRRLTPPLSEECESCWQATPWVVSDTYGAPPTALDLPELHPHPGGVVVWLQGGTMAVLAEGTETPRFVLRERDELGEPLVVGERVYLGAAKEALALSLDKCRFEDRARVASLELAGEGCLEARLPTTSTAFARPQRLGDAVYFLADGRVFQMKGGLKGWVAEVEADALVGLERGGRHMLLAAVHWTMDHPARLVALDPDSGRTLTQIDLPMSKMSILEVVLGVDGEALYAETSRRLYRWELATLLRAL